MISMQVWVKCLSKYSSTWHVSVTESDLWPCYSYLSTCHWLKGPSCLCIVKVHLYHLFTFNSLWLICHWLHRKGLWGVTSHVFPNIEILNLIMGMCFIICVNEGPSHPIANPFLTIISLKRVYISLFGKFLDTKQYRVLSDRESWIPWKLCLLSFTFDNFAFIFAYCIAVVV